MEQDPATLQLCLKSYPFEDGDIPLTRISGRPAGQAEGAGGPIWVGKLDVHGRIRIDCKNYPAAWMQIDLPQEVVVAIRNYQTRQKLGGSSAPRKSAE